MWSHRALDSWQSTGRIYQEDDQIIFEQATPFQIYIPTQIPAEMEFCIEVQGQILFPNNQIQVWAESSEPLETTPVMLSTRLSYRHASFRSLRPVRRVGVWVRHHDLSQSFLLKSIKVLAGSRPSAPVFPITTATAAPQPPRGLIGGLRMFENAWVGIYHGNHEASRDALRCKYIDRPTHLVAIPAEAEPDWVPIRRCPPFQVPPEIYTPTHERVHVELIPGDSEQPFDFLTPVGVQGSLWTADGALVGWCDRGRGIFWSRIEGKRLQPIPPLLTQWANPISWILLGLTHHELRGWIHVGTHTLIPRHALILEWHQERHQIKIYLYLPADRYQKLNVVQIELEGTE